MVVTHPIPGLPDLDPWPWNTCACERNSVSVPINQKVCFVLFLAAPDDDAELVEERKERGKARLIDCDEMVDWRPVWRSQPAGSIFPTYL